MNMTRRVLRLATLATLLGLSPAAFADPADAARDPADLPPPVGKRAPKLVKVSLAASEVIGTLDAKSRAARGLSGYLDVTGPQDPSIFHEGAAGPLQSKR